MHDLHLQITKGEETVMMYKVKLSKEDMPLKQKKDMEKMLADLLKILPTLRKHGVEADIQKKVRVLRDGRKQKHYTLELTRKFNSYTDLKPELGINKYHLPKIAKSKGLPADTFFEVEEVIKQKPTSTELKVTAPLTKEEATIDGVTKRIPVNKTKVLAELKEKILNQVKEHRKKQKVVYEDHTFREGLKVPKLGDVYLEPNTFVKLIDKRFRFNMVKGKYPKEEKTKYVGIEIEFAAKEDRETVCDVLHAAGLSKYICIKNDGSIGRAGGDRDKATPMMKEFKHGHEIALLLKETEVEEILPKFCDVLNKQLHVAVDHTCGLHVHLDMRNREVAKSFSNLIMMQHFLFAMVPANRKTGKYSVPVKDKKFAPNNIADRDGHYDGVSQQAYTKYKTLEMRMHCGTTQANKIVNWIKFLISIADAPALDYSPETIKSVQSVLNISDELVNYCDSRIAKFAKEHKKEAKKSPTWMAPVAEVFTTPDQVSLEEQSEVA